MAKMHSSSYRVSVENKIERLVCCFKEEFSKTLKHCFKLFLYKISEAFVNSDKALSTLHKLTHVRPGLNLT